MRSKLLGLALCLCLQSCQQSPVGEPTVSPSPASTQLAVTPSATPALTPAVNATDIQAVFKAVTTRYESTVVPEDDGYTILEPLLNGPLPSGLASDLEELRLETAEQKQKFDTHLLPLLMEGMGKPTFVPTRVLQAGGPLINFRGLRQLVRLTAERADQLWSEGKKKKAQEVLAAPLALAQAMRSRPQTVSSYLFEASYAESSLNLIPKWLEDSGAAPELVLELSQLVRQQAPNYDQLRETVDVDFAQLFNSLKTAEGRENLGIGQLEPSTLARWKDQLKTIYLEAIKLYELEENEDGTAFTQAVLAASTPIQGIVIDYPAVSTMQKHSFARYKAYELGLALLGPTSKELKALESEELIKKVFAAEPDTAVAVVSLVQVELKGDSIRIVGKPGIFELIAPGVEPVFFEYHPNLDLEPTP